MHFPRAGMKGSTDPCLPQPWVQEEIPSLELALAHCSQCPTASGVSPASPGQELQDWDCSQETCLPKSLGPWVVVGSCQAQAARCP